MGIHTVIQSSLKCVPCGLEEHAGVSEQDAKKIEVELDNEREVTFYEVEFKAGGYEYEYKISAEDLSVLHSEKERD